MQHLPEPVATSLDLRLILKFLDQCNVCQGNPDPKFAPIVSCNKGILKDRMGEFSMLNISRYMFHYFPTGSKVNAYFDHQKLTIRHVSCHWLLPNCDKQRCPVSIQYRESLLRSKLRSVLRDTKEDGSAASSHVNYQYLDTPTKLRKIRNLHSLVRKQSRQIKTLQEKISNHMQASGIRINSEAHNNLSDLMEKYGKSVTEERVWGGFISVNFLDATDEGINCKEKNCN